MRALKICGLLPGDNLEFVDGRIVTHVGFVFVSGSKRKISAEHARMMTAKLPDNVRAVGVFVNSPVHEVLETVRTAGLSVAQLHGSEPPEDCARLRTQGVKVWRAIGVPRERADVSIIARQIQDYAAHVDGVLLDAAPPQGTGNVSGGHGLSWDWAILERLIREADLAESIDLWLAGGIRPDNVTELPRLTRDYGVDVSSGVETNGRKSREKIEAMIKAVNS